MKFFVDTADVKQIEEVNKWFPLAGVTTNPALVAKSGKEHHNLIRSICNIVRGPVSAEVLATSSKEMIKEAQVLDDIGLDGMEIVAQTIQIFSQYQIKTKVLVASVRHLSHVLVAAELGADLITMPPALFIKMVEHPLTDKGLIQFLKAAGRKVD